jgi:toxin ParE1/3/4
MARLVISPAAEKDLSDILEYIARDKPEAAVNWVAKIRRTFKVVADNPEIGERRPEFKTSNFRSTLVGRYVVIYRPITDGIENARITSGARDIRNL